MKPRETILQILESDSPTDRVAVSMVHCDVTGESRIRLRQESFSDAVGWFTQSQIDLSSDQVGQLKSVLGPAVLKPAGASGPQKPAARHRSAAAERFAEEPAILKMPSILAG